VPKQINTLYKYTSVLGVIEWRGIGDKCTTSKGTCKPFSKLTDKFQECKKMHA
jgi:hypothetical protein